MEGVSMRDVMHSDGVDLYQADSEVMTNITT
jgi:hypothetical protein